MFLIKPMFFLYFPVVMGIMVQLPNSGSDIHILYIDFLHHDRASVMAPHATTDSYRKLCHNFETKLAKSLLGGFEAQLPKCCSYCTSDAPHVLDT